MADKIYRVTGVTKKGHMRSYAYDVWAKNAKEAKTIALDDWAKVHPDMHLFWAEAKPCDSSSFHSRVGWIKTGESVNGHWVDYV